MFVFLAAISLVAVGSCQIHTLSPSELQQCAADLACSVDYSNIFQSKLDNATNYMELELELLRHQTNNILVPVQNELAQLKVNHTQEVSVLYKAVERMETELAGDRDQLTNLTRGIYELNDNFHKENIDRFQEIHSLQLQLAAAKNDITVLTSMVTSLVTQAGNGTSDSQILSLGQGLSGTAGDCTAKDAEITELSSNLTYFMNSLSSTQKLLENVRALESFLQGQVVQLKANLTKAENTNRIKDNLIVSLQNQLKLAQTNAAPSLGTCNSDLGMKSGIIPPSAVTASASQSGYEPTHARLDDGQGWYSPERTSSSDYLQIDTGTIHYITKVATQGAPCCDVMVTNYTLQYSTDGTTWKDYKKDCQTEYLAGNTDASTVVEHTLNMPVLARYVRFNVAGFKKDGISNYVGMRVELYGCKKQP